MSFRKIVRLVPLPAILVVMIMTAALAAQEPPSKVDIYAGYAWLHPGANNNGVTGIKDIPMGFTVNSTYFANRYAGFSFDAGGHFVAPRCARVNPRAILASAFVRPFREMVGRSVQAVRARGSGTSAHTRAPPSYSTPHRVVSLSTR